MNWRDEATKHAAAEYPKEACGLVVVVNGRERYWPCENQSDNPDNFVMSAEQWAEAEDAGAIIGLFHSHPNAAPTPSEADRASCEQSGIKWHILGWPVGTWAEIEPCGFEAPLEGRQFHHGVLDCWSLVRDWYRRERGVQLRDFARQDDWWEKGGDLYRQHLPEAGFVPAETLEYGCLVLMQIGSSVPNHGAVYVGNDTILHHLHGRLSSRDVYGGYYRQVTVGIFKYAPDQALR